MRGAAAPGAPDELADTRRFAEMLELPDACPHRPCKGGFCQGPRGATEALPGAVLPECLAAYFEELHAPVRRWEAFWEVMSQHRTRLKALQARLEAQVAAERGSSGQARG